MPIPISKKQEITLNEIHAHIGEMTTVLAAKVFKLYNKNSADPDEIMSEAMQMVWETVCEINDYIIDVVREKKVLIRKIK